MINLQPVLQSEILFLRPLRSEDFEELYAVASDPKIWEQHPQNKRYKREVFQTFFNEGIESKGGLVVIDSQTKKIIGSSRYYDYDPDKNELTVGCTFLGRNYWGGKYNNELKRLMINHALSMVQTVLFIVDQSNIRSQKALLKIGASFSMNREKIRADGSVGFDCIYKICRCLELQI